MAKAIGLAAAAYKLVWVRVFLYILIPIGSAFMGAAVDMTDEKWEAMKTFSKWKFFIPILIPGATALAAFIDSSLPRAREKHEQAKREQRISDMNPTEAP